MQATLCRYVSSRRARSSYWAKAPTSAPGTLHMLFLARTLNPLRGRADRRRKVFYLVVRRGQRRTKKTTATSLAGIEAKPPNKEEPRARRRRNRAPAGQGRQRANYKASFFAACVVFERFRSAANSINDDDNELFNHKPAYAVPVATTRPDQKKKPKGKKN